jgi:2-oxoglutarate dehydrogenase E1 component
MAFDPLIEGNHVRITGQDVQRGTFSHRHASVKDQDSEEEYYLESLDKPSRRHHGRVAQTDTQASFTCRNSFRICRRSLNTDTVWRIPTRSSCGKPSLETVNGAQTMIDQFISSGEDKWLPPDGLVCCARIDGRGWRTLSCRLERFLQQVDEDPDYIPRLADERMQIQHATGKL